MLIDAISSKIIQIALYLDSLNPGLVSEKWIDEQTLSLLQENIPSQETISDLVSQTYEKIDLMADKRRSQYLKGILSALEYQLDIKNVQSSTYQEFSENTFNFKIERISEDEIREIELKLEDLAKYTGKNRVLTLKKYELLPDEYDATFQKYVTQAKKMLPPNILDFPDNGFEFEIVSNKPWSAFNSHFSPFKSKLTLNSDIPFTRLDLFRLAFHEAYGGHHSELSNKDKLLLNDARGEHGIVITFSPQTFISEAIAEGTFVLLGGLDKNDPDSMTSWYYDRLVFALYNLATHLFFDDHKSRVEIEHELRRYAINDISITNLLNFSTDPIFGRYAPVYYSAFNFIEKMYNQTVLKTELMQKLFTQPYTPEMLIREFEVK